MEIIGENMRKTNEEFIVIRTFEAKTHKINDLLKALYSSLEATKNESGFLNYEIYQNADYPDKLTVIEKFKNKDAFELHLKQPYFIAFENSLLQLSSSSDWYGNKIADVSSD